MKENLRLNELWTERIMNVFIVYCHPSRKSFTYRILNSLLNGLRMSGHNIVISDLYEMGFQSDMSEAEYDREGFARLEKPVPDDVLAEQRKIEQSDCIIFIYPVWWSDCPAKLKGWFDRVYSVGYAYGYNDTGEKQIQMKTLKLGLVLCTAGHPNEFFDETGIGESMRKVMIEDRLGQRFINKQMIILGGTLDLGRVGKRHLQKAFAVGRDIESFCSPSA